MDEGWTRWMLEQYGFEYVTLRPADFKSPLTGKVDVVILADDARLPLEGAAAAVAAAADAVAGREVRPEYADRLSPADVANFEQFVRAGGTVVCLNYGLDVRDSAIQTSGPQRGRRPASRGVLPARNHCRSWRGSRQPGDGRPPGKGRRVRGQQPRVRNAGGLQGASDSPNTPSPGSPLLSGYLIGETAAGRQGSGTRRATRRRSCASCSASGRTGAVNRSARSR